MDDQRPQQLLSVNDTAARLSVGRTTVFGLIQSGELVSLKLGAKRLITADSVQQLIDRLSSEPRM